MPNNGWFLIHRKLFQHDIADNPLIVALWVRLIADASYEDKDVWWNGQVVKIKRGQLITSIHKLAKWLRLAESTSKQHLNALQNIGQIDIKTTNKYTVITIKNYNKYQVDRIQTEFKPNSNRIQTETTKEDNKYKEIKEYIHVDKQRAQKITEHKRLPEEKQTPLYKIAYFYEDTLHTRIVNWAKELLAIKKMLQSGYTENNIRWTIKEMMLNDYWSEKGFDLSQVANQIAKYKALNERRKIDQEKHKQ